MVTHKMKENEMPRYMETATQLHDQIRSFLVEHFGFDKELSPEELQKKFNAAKEIGFIVNLAVRCAPRSVQGTVRKNIVAKAVEGYCDVGMHKVTDKNTGRSYNKISIVARHALPRTPRTVEQDTPKQHGCQFNSEHSLTPEQSQADFDAQNGAKVEPVGFEEHPDHTESSNRI
jgi:hypothetical protein